MKIAPGLQTFTGNKGHCILYNVSETAIYIHYSMINTKLDVNIWSFRYKKDLQDPTTANLQDDEEIEFEIYDSI